MVVGATLGSVVAPDGGSALVVVVAEVQAGCEGVGGALVPEGRAGRGVGVDTAVHLVLALARTTGGERLAVGRWASGDRCGSNGGGRRGNGGGGGGLSPRAGSRSGGGGGDSRRGGGPVQPGWVNVGRGRGLHGGRGRGPVQPSWVDDRGRSGGGGVPVNPGWVDNRGGDDRGLLGRGRGVPVGPGYWSGGGGLLSWRGGSGGGSPVGPCRVGNPVPVTGDDLGDDLADRLVGDDGGCQGGRGQDCAGVFDHGDFWSVCFERFKE